MCVACDTGYYRVGNASPVNNVCNSISPGYKAVVSTFAQLGLPTLEVSDGVFMATLIREPSGRNYTGLLKTELQPCPTGTEAFLNGTARVPAAPAGASHAATVTADNSCKPCDANTFASKTGTAKCQLCKAGSFPTRSFAGTVKPEPSLGGPVARGNDQCTLCPLGFYRAPQSTKCVPAACLPACLPGRMPACLPASSGCAALTPPAPHPPLSFSAGPPATSARVATRPASPRAVLPARLAAPATPTAPAPGLCLAPT